MTSPRRSSSTHFRSSRTTRLSTIPTGACSRSGCWRTGGTRQLTARAALIVMNLVWAWAIRFFVGYPWEGWTRGLAHEDWRYIDLRKKLGKGYWPFSLSSLHLTPTLLVFGALAPAGAVIVQDEAPPLNVGDLVACVVTLAFLVLEAVADETLRRHRASGAKTTCVRGPWAWSRHPNYLGECGFWTGIYLPFSRAAGISDLSYAIGRRRCGFSSAPRRRR